jgi:homoserine/homoserine lactone efflux protein
MDGTIWLVYLVASIGLSLTPGPNGLLALTHGAIYGRRRTLFTIVGGAVGFVAVMALSLFGIGALLQASIVWLTALKWIGGAYLVYLGITVWRSPAIELTAATTRKPPSGWLLFQQGALSALTNPKGILFFIAFLPQFIDPARSLVGQFLIMAGTFVVIEVTTEFLFASAASRLRPWLRRAGRRFNQACGGLFVVIGSVLPFRS